MNLLAVVAYDGTASPGFQLQAGEPTVQGALEAVLTRLAQAPVRVVAAGRTDAGVHAQGQVITFCIPWQHGLSALHQALNALLPDDIVVSEVREAPAGFHPRFSARSREYRYTILNQPWRSPWLRFTSWHVKQPLDVKAMRQALSYLEGRHDFGVFGRAPQGDNTTRTIIRTDCQRHGHLILVDIEADAFLHRMVRRIVGALVRIGSGEFPPEQMALWLAGQSPKLPPPAPPQGLCLMKVNYQ